MMDIRTKTALLGGGRNWFRIVSDGGIWY